MKIKINVGDIVKYSRKFLQSTAQLTGDVPFDVGVVTKIDNYGGDFILATIVWKLDSPRRVNVGNLVLKSRVHLEPV